MPVPFLVPVIGALAGTAAAPALGMSAALAAGLGGGIATLAAGGTPQEALMSGITGGIGGALVPGIAGAAGQGAAAAAGQGATQAATQGATNAAAKMTAGQIAQSTAAASGGAATNQLTQEAIKKVAAEGAKKSINPMTAMTAMSMMGGGQSQPQPAAAAPSMSLPMRPGGGGAAPTSADAMQNFSQMEPGDIQMPQVQRNPGVEPVMKDSDDLNRIQLRFANGGLTSLAGDEMARRGMNSLPNLGDREQAYMMARREFAKGGYVEGPGTGTSDDIDAVIYQNGVPVQEALLSDGEFVMTEKAVKGAGNGDRNKGAAKMYQMMRQFEGAA